VKAVENFTAFDEIEAEAVGDVCAAQLRNVTQQFESAWDAGGDTKQALLDLFHTPSDFTKVIVVVVLLSSLSTHILLYDTLNSTYSAPPLNCLNSLPYHFLFHFNFSSHISLARTIISQG
jgi:hypothetical protein